MSTYRPTFANGVTPIVEESGRGGQTTVYPNMKEDQERRDFLRTMRESALEHDKHVLAYDKEVFPRKKRNTFVKHPSNKNVRSGKMDNKGHIDMQSIKVRYLRKTPKYSHLHGEKTILYITKSNLFETGTVEYLRWRIYSFKWDRFIPNMANCVNLKRHMKFNETREIKIARMQGLFDNITSTYSKATECVDDIKRLTPEVENLIEEVSGAANSINRITEALTGFLERENASNYVSIMIQAVTIFVDIIYAIHNHAMGLLPSIIIRFIDLCGIPHSLLSTISSWIVSMICPIQVREGTDENFIDAQEFIMEGAGDPSFVALLVGLVGVMLMGAIPSDKSMKRINESLRCFQVLVPSVDKLGLFFSQIIKILPECMTSWIQELCPEEYWIQACAPTGKFHEFFYEAMRMNSDSYRTRAAYDPVLQKEINILYTTGTIILDECTKLPDVNSKLFSLIQKAFKVIEDLAHIVDVNTGSRGVRPTPFCIYVYGDRGVGKSFLLNYIAKYLAPPEINSLNVVFPRNAKVKHWEGYTGQFCTMVDEFGQTRGKEGETDEYMEFMSMISPTPWKIPMAAIENKGINFCSKLVLVSSNVAYPNPNHIIDKEALHRRRHILVKANIKPEYATRDGQLDRTKVFSNCDHLEFVVCDALNPVGYKSKPYAFGDFMLFCKERFDVWQDQEKAAMEKLSGIGATVNLQGVELPRDYFPVPTENDDDYPHLGEYVTQYAFGTTEQGRRACLTRLLRGCSILNPIKFGIIKENFLSFYEIYDFSTSERNYINFICHMVANVLNIEDLDDYIPFSEEVVMHEVNIINRQSFLFDYFRHFYEDSDEEDSDIEEISDDESMPELIFQMEGLHRPSLVNTLMAKLTNQGETLRQIYCEDFVKIVDDLKISKDLWFEQHPRIGRIMTHWKLILGCLGLVSILVGTFALFKRSQITHPVEQEASFMEVYSGDLRRKQRTVVGSEGGSIYTAGEERRKKCTVVLAEGSEDPNADAIISARIIPNMCRFNPHGGNGVLGIGFYGKVMLVPSHAFLSWETGQLLPEDTLIDIDLGYGGSLVKFSVPLRYDWIAEIPGKDFACYYCGPRMRSFKDSRDHFVSERDLANHSKFAATFVNFDRNTQLPMLQQVQVKPIDKVQYSAAVGVEGAKKFMLRNGWEYNATTVKGDCGSVLVARDCRITKKIVGIHVGGFANQSRGVSELITGEMIQSCLDRLPDQIFGLPKPQIQGFHDDLSKCSVVPEGAFSILGVVPPSMASRNPVSHDIRESIIYEKCFKHVSEPSVLHPNDPRLEKKFSVLGKGVSKYGSYPCPKPLNTKRLKRVVDDIIQELKSLPYNGPKRLLTEKESINGLGIEHFDGINKQTSPGWPYRNLNRGMVGKMGLFAGGEHNLEVSDVVLRKDLDDRFEMCRLGIRPPSVWTDCLKVERRPLDKIKEGKTRVFCISNVGFTIFARQYTQCFVAFMEENRLRMESAIGINPQSYEWTTLMNELRANSPWGFAGDFGRYDSTLMPECISAMCDIINAWYDDGSENARIRSVIFDEIIHTISLCNNCVYAKHRGNPSGSPMTSLINTLVNMIYTRYMYLELAEICAPEHCNFVSFRKFVRAFMYGDDNIFSVAEEILSWFNMRTLSVLYKDYGLEFTNADKSNIDTPYYKVEDMTFLKCGFRKVGPFYFPLMDKNTIQELTNWVRESEDPEEMCISNCNDALRHAYFYGRDYFESLRGKMILAFNEIGVFPNLYDFMAFVQIFNNEGLTLPVSEYKNGSGINYARGDYVTSVGEEVTLTTISPTSVNLGRTEDDFYIQGQKQPNMSGQFRNRKQASNRQRGTGISREKNPEQKQMALNVAATRQLEAENAALAKMTIVATLENVAKDLRAVFGMQGFEMQGEPGVQVKSTLGVTFEEQTAPTRERAYRGQDLTGAQASVANENLRDTHWTIDKMVQRPTLVGTYAWSTSDVLMTSLVKLNMPEDVLVSSLLSTPFDRYNFWRGDIKVRVQLNGTPFHVGKLLMYYAPLCTGQLVDAWHQKNLAAATTVPHVYIDASASSVVELTIPYINPQGYIRINNGTDPLLDFLGTLQISVFNPLLVSTGSSATLSLALWVEFINSDFKIPSMVPDSTSQVPMMLCGKEVIMQGAGYSHPGEKEVSWWDKNPPLITTVKLYDYGVEIASVTEITDTITVSNAPGNFRVIINGQEWMKPSEVEMEGIVDSVRGMTNSLLDAFSSIEESVLPKNITGDAFDLISLASAMDKPAYTANPGLVTRHAIQNLANSEGIEYLERMAMHADSQNECDFSHFATKVDEMDMKYLTTLPTFEQTNSWDLTQVDGSAIWNRCVAPNAWTLGVLPSDMGPTGATATPPRVFTPTLMDYVSMPYGFWRGGMKYKIMITASKFHTGRLWLCMNYGSMLVPTTLNSALNQYGVLIDLQDQEHEWTFTIPYMHPNPWCKMIHGPFRPTDKQLDYCLGNLSLWVVNRLVAPDNVAPSVYINLYHCGADDYELCFPCSVNTSFCPVSYINYPAPQPIEEDQYEEIDDGYLIPSFEMQSAPADVVQDMLEAEVDQGEAIAPTPVKLQSDRHFMDTSLSIRDDLKRYTPLIPFDNTLSQQINQNWGTASQTGNVTYYSCARSMPVNIPLHIGEYGDLGIPNTTPPTEYYPYHDRSGNRGLLGWFGPMYRLWRGSMRYKFVFDLSFGQNPQRGFIAFDPNVCWTTSDDQTNNGTFPTGAAQTIALAEAFSSHYTNFLSVGNALTISGPSITYGGNIYSMQSHATRGSNFPMALSEVNAQYCELEIPFQTQYSSILTPIQQTYDQQITPLTCVGQLIVGVMGPRYSNTSSANAYNTGGTIYQAVGDDFRMGCLLGPPAVMARGVIGWNTSAHHPGFVTSYPGDNLGTYSLGG